MIMAIPDVDVVARTSPPRSAKRIGGSWLLAQYGLTPALLRLRVPYRVSSFSQWKTDQPEQFLSFRPYRGAGAGRGPARAESSR